MPPEDEPDWTEAVYGTPYEIKVHMADNPPLFAWAEYENALMEGNKEYLKELLYDRGVLQKHYEWIESLTESRELPDTVLKRKNNLIAEKYGYKWEGGCSGMDNTPRGRTGEKANCVRPNNPNMLWIDAICQQALSARSISKLFAILDDEKSAKIWNERYEEKKQIVNELYWDKRDEFYYDIDCETHDFYKVMTIASFWTLTAEIADKKQAEALVKQVSNPETFGGFVPLVSLSRSDSDYCKDGVYWRGAMWLPTAYATLKGMANYGFYREAHDAAWKILEHMQKTYAEFEPHSIWECYSPEEHKPAHNEHSGDGAGYVRKDFCGWSALGPISVYIEFVLGFHTINAFEKTVKWAKPEEFSEKIGIKNLHFADIVTDIVADKNICTVNSTGEYTLEINGQKYEISEGENTITL